MTIRPFLRKGTEHPFAQKLDHLHARIWLSDSSAHLKRTRERLVAKCEGTISSAKGRLGICVLPDNAHETQVGALPQDELLPASCIKIIAKFKLEITNLPANMSKIEVASQLLASGVTCIPEFSWKTAGENARGWPTPNTMTALRVSSWSGNP